MPAMNRMATAASALARKLSLSSRRRGRTAGRASNKPSRRTSATKPIAPLWTRASRKFFRLFRCDRDHGLSRAHIVEAVVSAQRDRVFARLQIAQCKFVGLLLAVADSRLGSDERPFAAVKAELRPLDAGSGIGSGEFDLCGAVRYAGIDFADDRRRVVHFKPFAFALRCKRFVGRV